MHMVSDSAGWALIMANLVISARRYCCYGPIKLRPRWGLNLPIECRRALGCRLCATSLTVLVLFVSILSPSRAAEQISIHTMRAQAPSYELRLVTLRGQVKDMQATPPISSMTHMPECIIYGQGTFILEDDTGSLPVEVFGSCGSESADALPKDGDQVVLNAVIRVSKEEMPIRVWAQAAEMRLFPDTTK
jgi:hypothetical protein